MENTNTVRFENDQPEFYFAVGEKYRGPFKASEIYERLQSKELSWIDYVYREKEGQWVRIADHATFNSLQPAPPKPKPMPKDVTAAPPPPPAAPKDDIKWFLFHNENQTGPYSTNELRRLIQIGQVNDGAFVWQEAFSGWKVYNEVEELRIDRGSAPKPPPAPNGEKSGAEKRQGPRKPLVAQVYATNLSALISGICRDISIGGMQVLTDTLPGPVGTSIRLNVTPPSDSGVKAFVAEGTVVRILEDQRGFSFRFTQLTPDAKASIESYLK